MVLNIQFDLIFFDRRNNLAEDCVANEVRKPFIEELGRQLFPNNLIFVTLPQSRFRPVTTISPLSGNIILVKPWMPVPYRMLYQHVGRILQPFVRRLMLNQLKPVLSNIKFGHNKSIVSIFGHPFLSIFRGLLSEELMVYDCNDEYAYTEQQFDELVRREELRFSSQCDLVLASARTLFDRLQIVSKNIHSMPNACEISHFLDVQNLSNKEGFPLNVPRPVVGFMGNLHRWVDFRIIRSIVQCSAVSSVVFLGETTSKDIENELAWLRSQTKVHFLGWQPWENVPYIIRQFDVAIIPFEINPWTDAVSPDKLFQYLSLGLPVVATPTYELKQFSDLIYLAESGKFCQAIETALAEPLEKRQLRINFIQERCTWKVRVHEMLQVVQKLLEKKVS